jgi:DNA mismatch endonuclease (patch repair protein)
MPRDPNLTFDEWLRRGRKHRRRGMEGLHHSSDTVERMSNAAKARPNYGFKKGYTPWNKGIKGLFHDSEETKQKKSRAKQGHTHGMTGKRFSEESRRRLRIARAKNPIPCKDTKIEVAVQKGLTDLGILFRKHEPILGQPDIFISPNLCIFADGIYWHTKPADIKRDKYVNNELKNQGYVVLRFLEGSIKKNIDRVISTICHYIPHADSKNS